MIPHPIRALIEQCHRYTITGEGASKGYYRLVEDPAGAWLQWPEVEAALAGAEAQPIHLAVKALRDSLWDGMAKADQQRPDYIVTKFVHSLDEILAGAEAEARPVPKIQDYRVALDNLMNRRGRPILDMLFEKHGSDARYQTAMLLGDIAKLFDVNDPSGPQVPLQKNWSAAGEAEARHEFVWDGSGACEECGKTLTEHASGSDVIARYEKDRREMIAALERLGIVGSESMSEGIAKLIDRLGEAEARSSPLDLEAEILDSLRVGYLFGNHDEPLDASGRRLLRVIQQRLHAKDQDHRDERPELPNVSSVRPTTPQDDLALHGLSSEKVKKLARSFAQEWLRPNDPDAATPALTDTLQTAMLAFFACATQKVGGEARSGVPQPQPAVVADIYLLCTACKTEVQVVDWTGVCPNCGNGTMREMTQKPAVVPRSMLDAIDRCRRGCYSPQDVKLMAMAFDGVNTEPAVVPAPPVESRSVQRRKALTRGEPMPAFDVPAPPKE